MRININIQESNVSLHKLKKNHALIVDAQTFMRFHDLFDSDLLKWVPYFFIPIAFKLFSFSNLILQECLNHSKRMGDGEE